MNKLLNDVVLGSDPELFITDIQGKFIPAWNVLEGSKVNPKPLGDGYFIQIDNALGEFNVPPASSKLEFIANIKEGLKRSSKELPDGYVFKIATSHNFTKEQLDHYMASQFGCESDRSAARMGAYNPKPKPPKDGLRCAGGHIHVGYKGDPDDKQLNDINIVKWMDILLGVPSMKLDKDKLRRRLYGKAGAYREKKYGVEYRTLSSFWLGSDELVGWVYDQTMKAVDRVNEKESLEEEDGKLVQLAINKSDEKAIDYLCEKYNLAV